MKASPTSSILRQLLKLRLDYTATGTTTKLALLDQLEFAELATPKEIIGLHEFLCFVQAYPDNRSILRLAQRLLKGFAARRDLARNRRSLFDTGISGTVIHYRFHWRTAKWLYDNWPSSVSIDWPEFENRRRLNELWPLILPFAAVEALEHIELSPRTWIEQLKPSFETDAAFLIRLFARWPVVEAVREKCYDDLDVPLILVPTKGSPSRTLSRNKSKVFVFGPPANRSAKQRPRKPRSAPQEDRVAGPAEGGRLVSLGRIQMVTRNRDLYAFMNADPHDVRLLRFDGGIEFIGYGLKPEARSLLESMYVFIIMRNGVPIGYTQASTLFRSAEINFNIFDTFRGVETSRVFETTLDMVAYLFACDTFIINSQQLGEDNVEALKTGAFWFYHKHGFRSCDTRICDIVTRELARKRRDPGYRCGLPTLKKLATDDIYLFLHKPHDVLVNNLNTDRIGLAAARVLESYAKPSDPTGTRGCRSAAANLLGYGSDQSLTPAQRLTWARWAPLVLALPGVSRWGQANKRALAEVINAKGGRRESDYVARFDRHHTLRRAIVKLGMGLPNV